MDRVSDSKPIQQPHEGHSGVSGWLEDNVLVPAVNGSGFLQIYNNFTDKPVELHQEKGCWAVQTLSSAAGAIIPMVVAGKLFGSGMRAAGEGLGATPTIAKFLCNEGLAQTLGATVYEAAKKPNQGETRLGNSLATALSFAVYSKGNSLMGTGPLAENAVTNGLLKGAARFGIGAAGGLASYDVSHFVANLQGVHSQTDWNSRMTAMATGGFTNVALPVVQDGLSKGVHAVLSRFEGYRGEPVQRLLKDSQYDQPEIRQAIDENPFARFKRVYGDDAVSKALLDNNSIQLADGDGAPRAAHELSHLATAKQQAMEGVFQKIADTIKVDPERAEADYYLAREYSEFKARQAENNVAARQNGETPVAVNRAEVANQMANGPRIYRQVWADDWAKFQKDPTYRPVEYGGDAATPKGAPADVKGDAVPQAAAVKGEAAEPFKVSQGLSRRADGLGADGAWVVDKNIDPDGYNKFIAARTAQGLPEPGPDGIKGINFGVYSENAKDVKVLLFPDANATEPSQVIPLSKGDNNIWHAFVDGAPNLQKYLVTADGAWDPKNGNVFNQGMGLIEPWTKATTGDTNRPMAYDDTHAALAARMQTGDPGDPTRFARKGTESSIETMPKSIAMSDAFPWDGDKPLNHAPEDMNIYEMNVKGFTAGDTSLGAKAGKFLGLVEKIPYLKRMGYTDVEFEPVAESDQKMILMDTNPESPTFGKAKGIFNDSWRYNAVAYGAPDGDLGMDPAHGSVVPEMKYTIQQLHNNDIGVILDKVFNHTTEGGKTGPTVSFKGLDNKTYYMLDPTGKYIDHTGCDNTMNVNHPQVRKLILDTLKYWVQEYHVDGFRFDLASVFNYDVDNVDKVKPPIISEIENDPVLANTRMMAEPWSTTNYKLGHFSDQKWGEWNGRYRDNMRAYLRGDNGQIAELANRIAGSPDWFDRSKGRFSVDMDFVHDGKKKLDGQTWEGKYNLENRENNTDGTGDDISANHGVEGPTDDPKINADRVRAVKNFAAMKMLSLGTPISLAGDEMMQTADGNNNYWQLDRYNTIDWSLVEKNKGMVDYHALANANRKDLAIGHNDPHQIEWYLPDGSKPQDANWHDPNAHFIAWQYKPTPTNPFSVYTASNAWWKDGINLKLPEGYNWSRVIDTNLPYGQDIVPVSKATPMGKDYYLQPQSVVSFIGKPIDQK